jgi:hypothetical protein
MLSPITDLSLDAASTPSVVASPAASTATTAPEALVVPTATVAATSTAPQQLLLEGPIVFEYRVNGVAVPAGCDRVPRGAVHAPEASPDGWVVL